jgi:hypothetical protein
MHSRKRFAMNRRDYRLAIERAEQEMKRMKKAEA